MLPLADVELNVFDTGGDLPAVVMLHGLGGHSLEWRWVASLLRHRHRLIAFDHRGHGGSTRRPADVSRESYVRDVIAVVDRLHLQRATLVGQSMGAHTAMLAVAAYPDLFQRMVMIEGGPSAAGPRATDNVIDWFRSWPIPFAGPQAALSFFESQYGAGRGAEAWAAGLQRTSVGLRPCFDLDVLREAIDSVHARDRWREWDAVVCPTTVIRGERGFLTSEEAEQMQERNRHATLVTVAAVHDAHLDNPAAVAHAV